MMYVQCRSCPINTNACCCCCCSVEERGERWWRQKGICHRTLRGSLPLRICCLFQTKKTHNMQGLCENVIKSLPFYCGLQSYGKITAFFLHDLSSTVSKTPPTLEGAGRGRAIYNKAGEKAEPCMTRSKAVILFSSPPAFCKPVFSAASRGRKKAIARRCDEKVSSSHPSLDAHVHLYCL